MREVWFADKEILSSGEYWSTWLISMTSKPSFRCPTCAPKKLVLISFFVTSVCRWTMTCGATNMAEATNGPEVWPLWAKLSKDECAELLAKIINEGWRRCVRERRCK